MSSSHLALLLGGARRFAGLCVFCGVGVAAVVVVVGELGDRSQNKGVFGWSGGE